ncbi:hypothetical protein [Candidatus Solincola tengchongensis]|uniref:hypothetical protein n=1 Tax=Candidatus Solincola tengchongensis TaxID=2900693 RepID=UPI002579B09F|nr:hypothetical protein [Candidatus Solincola tengchongensis]
MLRKLAITGALGLILAGVVTVSYTLATSGALESFNRRYNIFNMVDESLRGMQEMGGIMGEVRENVSALNEKLELVGKTNELLHRQMDVVDELNAAMSGQKPLLEETNESLGILEGKLHMTLNLARGLEPISASLLAAMRDSVALTQGVADGSSGMVSLASTISVLFDETLGYLARIQPKSAKAKAYMRGGIMSRLSEFVPHSEHTAGAKSGMPAPLPAQAGSPGNALLNPEVLRVIEQVSGNPVSGLLEGIGKLLGGR